MIAPPYDSGRPLTLLDGSPIVSRVGDLSLNQKEDVLFSTYLGDPECTEYCGNVQINAYPSGNLINSLPNYWVKHSEPIGVGESPNATF